MNILLDTCVLLWWLADDPALSGPAREAIADPDNVVHYSSASIWEIVIKRGLGKLEVPDEFAEVIAGQGFRALDITPAHALQVGQLADHHRVPFDRILIAQAQVEGLTIATRDPRVKAYEVPILEA